MFNSTTGILSVPSVNSGIDGTRDAYTSQTTPTSNNGIANAIAAAGIGGRVGAGVNYSNTEAADFDPFVQSVVHDRRVGRDTYYYRDPLGPNQGALAINCALTQRFTTNHYEAQGCFSTAAYYFGLGNNQGGGVTYNAVDRFLTANSYVPGIQSTGDEYILAAHSGDAHSHYRYISYGGDNRDLSAEGIQIDPAHMTQFANVFHGTVASVIDQRHIRVTPLYGQEIGGTYLIDQTVADSGLIIADNTSVAPEELTTSTTHTPSPAYGLTTTAIPVAADATNGTSVAVTVNVTSASPFAASGEACLLGPLGHEEVAYTATAISGGLQVLTAPFRYTETAGALISQGVCQYLRINSELQIDGSGNVTSDPYYVIAGARDSTHYWATTETTMNQGGIFISNSPARLPVNLTSTTSSRTSAGVVTTVFPLVGLNYTAISTLSAFPQLSVTGCVDTSFNFALQPVAASLGLDGLTMTYTQPLATTAGSTTGCVYTSGGLNAYEVHNGAEVQSVSDPAVNPTVANASAPVNGYYALAPNTVTWASKPVEQPMSARLGINNQLRWDQQTASTPGQNSSLIHWILNGQGTGGQGVTPFRVDNYDPCNKYIGCGGTWPSGTFMSVAGPYTQMFDVMAPMLNGTTLTIECPWVGCGSSVPYNVTASLGLGGASGFTYTPSTNSYGINTSNFAVNAGTIAIPHIDLSTVFTLNGQADPANLKAAFNLNDNEPSTQYMVPENMFCTNQANGQDCLINLGHSITANDSAFEFYTRSSNAAQQQLGFGFSQNAPNLSLFGNGHLSLGTGDNGFNLDVGSGSFQAGSISTGTITGTATNAGVNSTSSNAGRYAFQDVCLWNDQPLDIYGGTDHTCRTINNTYSSPGYDTTGHWSVNKALQFTSTVTGRGISQTIGMVTNAYKVGDNSSFYIYHHTRSAVTAGSDEGTEPGIFQSNEDNPPSGTISVGGAKATTITPSFTVNPGTQGDGMALVSTSEIMASGLLLSETQVPGETPFTITTSDTHAISTAIGALSSSCGTLTPRNAGASVTCSVTLTTGSFTTATQMCIGDAYPEQVAVTGVGTPSTTQNVTANLSYPHPAGTPVYQGGMCGARLALGYGYANPSTASGGYMTTFEVVGSRTATSLDAVSVFKGGQNGPQGIPIPSQQPITGMSLTRTSNVVTAFAPGNPGTWWNNFVAPPLASLQITGASDSTLNGTISSVESVVSGSYPQLLLTWPQTGANTTGTGATLTLVGYNNYVAYCGAETVAVGASTLQVDPNNCSWPVGGTIVQPNHYSQEDTVLSVNGTGVTKTYDPGTGLSIGLNGTKYAGGTYMGVFSSTPLTSFTGYGGVNYPMNLITTNAQNTPVLGSWISLPAPVDYGCVLCIGKIPEDGVHNPVDLRYNVVQAVNRDGSTNSISYDELAKSFNISNFGGSFTFGTIGGTGNGVNFNSISPNMTGQYLDWGITGDVVQIGRNTANTGMVIRRNTGDEFTVLDGAINQGIGANGYYGAIDLTTVAVTQPASTTGRGVATLDFVHSNQALGSVTTTAATSDVVTVTNATITSHCGLAATNASAATNITTTYISAKAANSITLTHAAIAGMTYDLVCTVN